MKNKQRERQTYRQSVKKADKHTHNRREYIGRQTKQLKKGTRKRIGSLHKSLCEKYAKMLYKLIRKIMWQQT